MAAPSQLLYSILTSKPFIGVGATLALFVDVLPGQLTTTIKNLGSTGVLEILPALSGLSLVAGGSNLYSTPNFISGSTQTLAMLAALNGTGYQMGAAEVLTFNGPCRFYLSQTGSTNQVCIMKGIGAGN